MADLQPLVVHFRDETISSLETPIVGDLALPRETVTLRELIAARVRREVETFNRGKRPTWLLQRHRDVSKAPLDWEREARMAERAFLQNGFLVLVRGQQLTDIEQEVELRPDDEVVFVRLLPIVGG